MIAAWLAGQAGALVLLDFLYKTQISQLRGSDVERQVMRSMLASSYFHWGSGHWALFAFARSFGVFQFSFGQLVLGDLAALLFLAGAILLLRRRSPRRTEVEPAAAWGISVVAFRHQLRCRGGGSLSVRRNAAQRISGPFCCWRA